MVAASQAAAGDWRARLRSRKAVGLLAPLALLLLLAAWAASNATAAEGRAPRQAYFILFGLPASLSLPLGMAAWRFLFPTGRLGRLPGWATWLLALVAVPASCLGPLPFFFFKVIDPIGNRNELALIRRGLTPLVREIHGETRRLGQPPDDIAPMLDRHFAAPPRWLYPLGAGNGGERVLFFQGRDRFALSVWGTPPHRDDTTRVVYTSWDDRWAWKDAWDLRREQVAASDPGWIGAGGAGLLEMACETTLPREAPWACRPVPKQGP